MAAEIPVPAIVREKTFIGKVSFPAAVPDGLAAMIEFPDDLQQWAPQLGLDEKAVRFLFGVLRGRPSVTAGLNLPDLAPRIGLSFDEIDAIVRDLIAKNYARCEERLDLYRLWVVILQLKGTRFVKED
jgi:hypothetical protein